MPYGTSQEFSSLPPWLKDLYQGLAEMSRNTAFEYYSDESDLDPTTGSPKIKARMRSPLKYEQGRLEPIHADMNLAHQLGRRTGLYEPYLESANEMIGRSSEEFPDNRNRYMNPYIDSVVNRISQEGGRTYREQILPQLEANFVGLGQHGGSRHQEMAERAARDLQAEILKRQEEALARGYQQAGQLFNADRTRQLENAREMESIGGLRQAGNLADIAALSDQARYLQQQGQVGKDIAYQDFLRQEEYPRQILAEHASILHGVPQQQHTSTFTQTPGTPQVNILGQMGSLASNILGASMLRKRHGGQIKRPSAYIKRRNCSSSDFESIKKHKRY